MKLKDKYAFKKDITLRDKSVRSGKTLDEMKTNPEGEWQSHKPGTEAKKTMTVNTRELLKKGKKTSFPLTEEPMLCSREYEPFNRENWIFELKLDGYRILAPIKKSKVVLHSRNAQDYTSRYPAAVNELKKIKYDAVIDG